MMMLEYWNAVMPGAGFHKWPMWVVECCLCLTSATIDHSLPDFRPQVISSRQEYWRGYAFFSWWIFPTEESNSGPCTAGRFLPTWDVEGAQGVTNERFLTFNRVYLWPVGKYRTESITYTPMKSSPVLLAWCKPLAEYKDVVFFRYMSSNCIFWQSLPWLYLQRHSKPVQNEELANTQTHKEWIFGILQPCASGCFLVTLAALPESLPVPGNPRVLRGVCEQWREMRLGSAVYFDTVV